MRQVSRGRQKSRAMAPTIDPSLELQQKHSLLITILSEMKSMLIAYSGGVDSTFLLKSAHGLLGDSVLAVTADSATLTRTELDEAREVAAAIGATHLVVKTDEFRSEDFIANPPERCYYCKTERFSALKDLQIERGFKWVAEGSNTDDDNDWRPGTQAARELGVRSPLKEAGLTKADIRELSRIVGLPTWDKPSAACLASRIPYGERITEDKLHQIAGAERYLKELGFTQLRVRHHGDLAKIEVPVDDMQEVLSRAAEITDSIKRHGFHFVALDLAGFKSGTMNASLDKNPRP